MVDYARRFKHYVFLGNGRYTLLEIYAHSARSDFSRNKELKISATVNPSGPILPNLLVTSFNINIGETFLSISFFPRLKKVTLNLKEIPIFSKVLHKSLQAGIFMYHIYIRMSYINRC